jgi:Protein of unknown function (DUF2726)
MLDGFLDNTGALAGLAMIAVALLLLAILRTPPPRNRVAAEPPAERDPPRRYRPRGSRQFYRYRTAPDYAHRQMGAVRAAPFVRRRLMNRSETGVFRIVEAELRQSFRSHRVFPQVSLGEILESSSRDAFQSINSKRVDMLVVDGDGSPILAIEYQGTGHYQGNAVIRDAIKKEAVTKAGIGYLELFPEDRPDDICRRLRDALCAPSPAARPGLSGPWRAVPTAGAADRSAVRRHSADADR